MKKNHHLAWIWKVWRERKGLIALLFVLTLTSSAVAVAYPYLSKVLIDMLQRLLEHPESASASSAEIRRLAMLVVAVGVGGYVASLFPGVRGAVNCVFEYLLRKKYFGKVMEKDYRFFSAFRTGDLTTRLTDDLSDYPKLSWFLCSGIFRAVESLSKVLFCLIAMLLLNWKLTLLSLIPIPVMIAVYAVAQDRIYDTYQHNQEAISEINNQLEMSFAGVRIIKSYNSERKYERFFSDALARRFGTEMAVAKLETLIQLIYQYIDYFAQIGIIFVGGYMAVKGQITIGTFYAFYNYLGMLIYPILDIPNLFVSGKRAFVNMDRLDELDDFPGPIGPAGPIGAAGPTGAAGHSSAAKVEPISEIDGLEVRDLGMRYEGREKDAVSGLSFKLERGERLAVVGPVGSGKTTLVKAIAGLMAPQEGEVLVNGRPLALIDPGAFADLLGYVPQDPLLFAGTIRENVAFGGRGEGKAITEAELVAALATAQIGDEVGSFSQGVDTLLGQRGVAVSGGQKQRIAIARALARHPELLLLDDITASLDAANEERLWRGLEKEARKITCIVVSHRLSTLNYTDKVLFLDGGRNLAFGRHEELLATSGAYRAFISEHFAGGEAS
jgi:ATP-binding cassette, subfamily B, multidrug efflux pump